jgi:hypothetical protein
MAALSTQSQGLGLRGANVHYIHSTDESGTHLSRPLTGKFQSIRSAFAAIGALYYSAKALEWAIACSALYKALGVSLSVVFGSLSVIMAVFALIFANEVFHVI